MFINNIFNCTKRKSMEIRFLFNKPDKSLLYVNVIHLKRNYASDCKVGTGTTPTAPSTGPVATSSRPVRQEPGPVRLGFIPEDWFTFFFSKTGVSGCGTFAFAFGTFLISKEYFVMEHEYYNGLSLGLMCILGCKYVGPMIAQALDKEIDEYEGMWTSNRTNQVSSLEESVANEEKNQWRADGQLMLIAAKRENVALQLESIYRQRLMTAFKETKKRLDYCVSREIVEAAIARRHMANWVIKEVGKDITEKIQAETLTKCFEDLNKLAKTFDSLKSPSKPDSPKK